MQNELDIVQLISLLRLSNFSNKMKLSTYQRYFINKGRQYHISSNQQENQEFCEKDAKDDNLIASGYNNGYQMQTVQEMVQ